MVRKMPTGPMSVIKNTITAQIMAFVSNCSNTHVSSMSFQPEIPGVYLISVRISSPLYSTPFIKGLPSPVKVRSPISNIQATFPFDMSYTKMYLQPDGRYATQVLGFSAHTFSEDVHFLYDFGDGSPVSYVQGSPGFFFGVAASCLHQFTRGK